MENTAPGHPAPGILKGFPAAAASLALLAIALGMTVPIYGGWLSGNAGRDFRFGLSLLWGVLALAAGAGARTRRYVPLLLALFGISLGFALAYLAAESSLSGLGGSWSTPKGAAYDKIFTEVITVCAAVFLAAVLARSSLRSLALRGGRVGLSIGWGLLATVPLIALFVLDPSGGKQAVLATPAATLGSWLPWIVLFSVGNGFMEELWFRGLWLGAFKQVLGWPAAIHVTSVAFCLMHVIVYWGDPVAIAILTPTWLFMGYGYALTVRKTGSLWGPVLAHAVADVLFLFIAFSTGRM